MLPALKNLVFALATLTAATAFAEHAQVSVPFNFVVEAHTFPAGSYEIIMDPTESYITLVSVKNAANHINVLVGPADKAHAEIVLKFSGAEKGYCLNTVQIGSRVTSQLSTCDKPNGAQYTVAAQ
jgi:hypothetical protein